MAFLILHTAEHLHATEKGLEDRGGQILVNYGFVFIQQYAQRCVQVRYRVIQTLPLPTSAT